MHELSLAVALVEQVEEILRREAVRELVAVTVAIGPLSGVERDAFAFCFPAAAQGTALEGTILHIEQVPVRLECPRCGRESQPVRPDLLYCGHCGSAEAAVSAGREFILRNLEVR